MSIKKNYTGNKGGQGMRETLINFVPLSNGYYSLFGGMAGFEKSKLCRNAFWMVAEPDLKLHASQTDNVIYEYKDYMDLIDDCLFTQEDFVFADPPYLFDCRANGRVYYANEFTVEDHLKFLNTILQLKAKVLITHPEHEIYLNKLSTWYRFPFLYMTHKGWFYDTIWTNYNPLNVKLLNYDCLGSNNTERQRIKRKRNNLISKFKKLSFHEQMAVLESSDFKQYLVVEKVK